MPDVNVVRNVRMPLSLDTEIRRIASLEDRTISNTIKRLLDYAVHHYLDCEQSAREYDLKTSDWDGKSHLLDRI